MQSSSKRALGVAALLVLALAVFLMLRQPSAPDQDQIAAQLDAARAAAQNHNVGGIMAVISSDFKGPSPISNVDSLHFGLRQALRDSGAVRVTFSPPNIVVTGDTATSTNQVTVRNAESGQPTFDQPVTLNWKREDSHRFLIFPTKIWRVVGTQYQGGLPGSD